DGVPVAGEPRPALRAEQDAGLPAAPHRVAADQVVRVTVPDRDSDRLRVLDGVLLREPVPDAPAEEQPDVAPGDGVVADDRPLRPGPGVQPQPGVVAALAVLDRDVVTDLPTDPVPAVAPGDHPADGDVGTVLQEDAPGMVPVQFLVV